MKNKIYMHRTITGETVDGSKKTLKIWIRTQYSESINMIGLEIKEDPNSIMANWAYPIKMILKMSNAIEEMINSKPCMVRRLYFKTDRKRAVLYARLFKRKGYNVHHQFDDIYRISRI